MSLTDEELRRLDELAGKATKGPYVVQGRSVFGLVVGQNPQGQDVRPTVSRHYNQDDAEYVAALSPEVVSRLVQEFLIMRMALEAIAGDEHLECRCGSEPYTDGELCPRCFAVDLLQRLKS
jgi:hypothetical protein